MKDCAWSKVVVFTTKIVEGMDMYLFSLPRLLIRLFNYFGSSCTPVVIFLLPLFSGCVTEVEGGYGVEVKPRVALDRRVELARQYVGRGDWENAKRNLELAYELDPDSPAVHEAFGLAYQGIGEHDRAERSFKRALHLAPVFSRARNNYAAFLFSLGRYSDAEREFEIVTQDPLYSGRPLAFINLGMSRLNLNDKAAAEVAFSRALRIDRRNPVALLEMSYLRLGAGDADGAEAYYDIYRTVVSRQSPRGLILGIEIAEAIGDNDASGSYELVLQSLYPDSQAYEAWKQKTR